MALSLPRGVRFVAGVSAALVLLDILTIIVADLQVSSDEIN
jgi:hypothetical protein